MLIVCFGSTKNNARVTEDSSAFNPIQYHLKDGFEKLKYEISKSLYNPIKRTSRKISREQDETVKKEGIVYYYYVMKRVR